MPKLTMRDRAAVLLSLLGEEAVGPVLDDLPAEQRSEIQASLTAFKEKPPAGEVIDQVVADFESFFSFASRTGSLVDVVDNGDPSVTPKKKPVEIDNSAVFVPSDDPIADINRMPVFRIAGALQDEQPRTVAVVLQCLPAERASQILEKLSSEVRGKTAVLLTKPNRGSEHLIRRIVRTTVEKGCEIEEQDAGESAEDGESRMAEVLRSASRNVRDEMLQALEESDAELAGRITEMLYVFEDIGRIEDRSLQNLLREIEVPVLARALTDADALIVEAINNNLAKRARESLKEEIELTGKLDQAEIDEARKKIAAEIARLDKEGQITMEEG